MPTNYKKSLIRIYYFTYPLSSKNVKIIISNTYSKEGNGVCLSLNPAKTTTDLTGKIAFVGLNLGGLA